ncbi:hypothetical protein QQ73_15500, partial [Candidatus Endoriftia persephone str. Guaymas]|nr:hypothetical protein [Candidatus Endoriftia persephone str. Guaymas]
MNTANWIPDLFMKRVAEEGDWTLFSPNEVPDLHDLTGAEFEAVYTACEEKAARGEIKVFRSLKAVDLWRKMLGMLFETGHPWITFKDPCNIRYTNQHAGVVHSSNLCTEITLHNPWITFKDPCNIRYTNQHAGVVHSSNLCTEITLHTNDSEIAVCNLGSVNLAAHVDENGLDIAKLER